MMPSDAAALASAAGEWIRETVRSASMTGVVVGLSGGLDSAVSAALAARALGAGAVLGMALPCGSIPEDLRDAELVAEHLGIPFRVIDLTPALDALADAAGLRGAPGVTLANVKSRLRMTVLYAHSAGRLVLGTSNWSEILVGYWTKWGDGAADLLPLARLYKSEVRAVAESLGLPARIVERIPSAGLWPGQSDEGEMGVTYDEIETFFRGGDPGSRASARIAEMVRASEHKRRPVPFFDAREWMGRHA